MKSKQLFGILLLLAGAILLGCTPDYPRGFMYEHHIEQSISQSFI